MQDSPDGALVLDLAGIIRWVNPAGASLLGAAKDAALVGERWTTLLAAPGRVVAQAAVDAAGEARFTAQLSEAAGRLARLDSVVSPLRDSAGAPAALLVIFRDVAALEERARLAEAKQSVVVRSAAEMARLVGMEIDFRRNRVVQVRDVNDPDHYDDTIENTLLIYEPEQRIRIRQYLERAQRYGEPFRYDAQVTMPDGLRGWVRVFGEPVYENGVCVGIRGAGMDITEEVAARETIQSARQRLRVAVELAGLEVYEFDFDRQKLIREGSSSIFDDGSGSRDVPLLEQIDTVDPEDRARVRAEWIEAQERNAPFRSEFRLRLHDGREVWVYCVAEIIHEDGRPRRLVAAVVDITARKRSELNLLETMAQMREHEMRQKLLLDELNHRVKNTLAAVQSIAAQTLADSRGLEEGRELFVERLLALSNTHNLLVKHAWASASLQELVQVVLAPYGRPYRYEGPGLELDPNFAVSLGMALHELAINALKHGAWRESGCVGIAVTLEAGMARIVWRESGGPRVSPPERRGFGSR